jgi:(p)ppGpp synthase/HD superfamily hydrolase
LSEQNSNPSSDGDKLVSEARAFAITAHGNQVRKYDGAPYVTHLDSVVTILKDHGYDAPTLLAAAYLHDTLEDTDTTMRQLIDAFGPEVAEIVYWLSDLEKGHRKVRKLMSAWRLSRAPIAAKIIKLADLSDNAPGIVANDPDFAKIWLSEKSIILELMAKVEGPKITATPLFKVAASHNTNTTDPGGP